MRMLLSFAVLALTASPAMAGDPPFKSEYRMRMNQDGRADLRDAISNRRDAYDRNASTHKETGSERIHREVTPPVPLKADIALRLQHGDNREGNSKNAAARPQVSENQGQIKHMPPVPFKADIALRMQHGDNREGDSKTSTGSAQKKDTASKGAFYHVLSMDQKEALCRQTGVCLPQKFNTGEADEK